MKEILNTVLFTLGGQQISFLQVLLSVGATFIVFLLYRTFIKKYYPKLTESSNIEEDTKKSMLLIIRWMVILSLILLFLNFYKLDYPLHFSETINLSIIQIVKALLFFQFARILDWFFNSILIDSFYKSHNQDTEQKKAFNLESLSVARRNVRYIFFTLIIIYILRNFGLDISMYDMTINDELVKFRLSKFFIAILVILVARLVIWSLTQIIFYRVYDNKHIDMGAQYAVNQLIKYVIYVIAFIFAMDVIGINMTILLGGAAALLVGIGLGLQQTFNDFISGIVLLFERSVSVGDVLEFDNTIGTVKKIGMRSSQVETRSNVSIIVPNHLLVNEKVINWTHYNSKVRFDISVGVAYGSNLELVKKLLIKAVKSNPYVLEYPLPTVRFVNFGDSALDFTVFFFSRNYMVIEDIRSDIRFEIAKLFDENKIIIPFPQRDINLRKLD